MARECHRWLTIVGKHLKRWKGHWFVYRMVNGKEKRVHRNKIIGSKADLKRWEAKDRLRFIAEAGTGAPRRIDGNATFSFFWEHRYLPTRIWQPATKSALVSVVKHPVLRGTTPY